MTIFNDCVHGTVELDTRLVKHIIDTPQFQRLRRIKQLGGVYYVFPGAQHNRFEHSIGTAHLAGKLARHLQKIHDKDLVSDKDILCLEIAGLGHDLGHGPFSHLFDRKFMKAFPPKNGKRKWTHEQGSCEILTSILKRKRTLENLNMNDEDITLINDMINPRDSQSSNDYDAAYQKRIKGKSFLFEIISNSTSGVDVDKWDYFARDCLHLGIPNGFDHNRFIRCTRLIKDEDEEWHICVRDKEVFNLYEMFHTRFTLHRRAYQHKSANAVEHMICDAMIAANDTVKVYSMDGKQYKMSECPRNIAAYLNLDDDVIKEISIWNGPTNPDVEKAKVLLQRLENGRRYKCVGNKILGTNVGKEKEHDIQVALERNDKNLRGNLKVSLVKFSYGSKGKDPVSNYRFYEKESAATTVKIPKEEVSFFLPDIFEEIGVQVFCTSDSENIISAAKTAFDKWYQQHKPKVIDKVRGVCESLRERTETEEPAKKILKLLDSV